jgi:hypothetical protein
MGMSSIASHINRRSHRGTFAWGLSHPGWYVDEDEVGRLASGGAVFERCSGEDHVGTFAGGRAQRDRYQREDRVGSFADGAVGQAA